MKQFLCNEEKRKAFPFTFSCKMEVKYPNSWYPYHCGSMVGHLLRVGTSMGIRFKLVG